MDKDFYKKRANKFIGEEFFMNNVSVGKCKNIKINDTYFTIILENNSKFDIDLEQLRNVNFWHKITV